MSAPITSYVAVGDSFSAGIPGLTPWPDLVADRLAQDSPGLYYANFARVGVTSAEVAADQLGPALARDPDLISLICGANDVIQSVRPDQLEFARTLAAMFERVRAEAPNAHVVTATYPPISPAWCRPRTRERVHEGLLAVNHTIRQVADSHGAGLVEWQTGTDGRARRYFATDGFHLSARGHTLVAKAFLAKIPSPPSEHTSRWEIA